MTDVLMTKKRKSRYLKSPESSDLEDDLVNKENNDFIDSIFSKEKSAFVQQLISFDSLGKSSIKVSKLVPTDLKPNKVDKSKRALSEQTNQYVSNSKLSIYDIINDGELSDQDLENLVNKSRKKRRAKKKPSKFVSKSKREAEKIRQEEEALLIDAMREYAEIKNYKLIVETVPCDY